MKGPARYTLAAFMITVGVLHFATPEFFVAIVPAWLPHATLLVAVSGVAEIAGGLGLLHPSTRRWAAIGLIALFVAVFPANINQALHHIPVNGREVPPALLWSRLLLQPVFIAWAWWCTRPSAA
jgi:uncharacterized membrane protein